VILFVESIETILKNLKTILSNYEIEFHSEKSRISKSQYLYIHFPNKDIYKFRFSDHEIPTHSDDLDYIVEPSREKLAGFYSFGEDEYNEAKKIISNLLALHKIPKRGQKPEWIEKIAVLYKDYRDSQDFKRNPIEYVDITNIFLILQKCSKSGIKSFYKYPTFSSLLKASEVEIMPEFLKKLMKKHGIN